MRRLLGVVVVVVLSAWALRAALAIPTMEECVVAGIVAGLA